jgi:hypothetical protein
MLPFEIVSVHLLVVLVGAAYLARAKRRRTPRPIDALASAMPVETVATAAPVATGRSAGGAKSALVGGGR